MNNSPLGGTKKTKNNWNDKIYSNDPAEGSEDGLRVGRVVMMSEDKDFLRKNLNQFKKTTGPTNVQHQANKVKRTKGNTATPPIATKTRAVSVKGREAVQQLQWETLRANKVPTPLHYKRRTMLALNVTCNRKMMI
ncbi:uncharacterized protein LOC123471137 isoform X1 [Daphnia magna]|uniref:uncharacterized protein LOC123471137 isoform X1 n=1 Tax=Daphnia magna TaxID=35525 RepID=UPI001E1BA0B2|nr:uncharacterized protein LOC123471137 isoform X1 [Daphnia magna]